MYLYVLIDIFLIHPSSTLIRDIMVYLLTNVCFLILAILLICLSKSLFSLILSNYHLQNLVKIYSFLFCVRYLQLSTEKQYFLNHACFDVLLIWLKSTLSLKKWEVCLSS